MSETNSVGGPPPATTDAAAGAPNTAAWDAQVQVAQSLAKFGVLTLGGTMIQMLNSAKAIGDEGAQD